MWCPCVYRKLFTKILIFSHLTKFLKLKISNKNINNQIVELKSSEVLFIGQRPQRSLFHSIQFSSTKNMPKITIMKKFFLSSFFVLPCHLVAKANSLNLAKTATPFGLPARELTISIKNGSTSAPPILRVWGASLPIAILPVLATALSMSHIIPRESTLKSEALRLV